jgi:hypothetical protein
MVHVSCYGCIDRKDAASLDEVLIVLCVVRLTSVGTDLVISLNVPMALAAQRQEGVAVETNWLRALGVGDALGEHIQVSARIQ